MKIKQSQCVNIIILGVVIFMASLWGGAYLIHVVEPWANFSAFITTLLGAVLGIALVIIGFSGLSEY